MTKMMDLVTRRPVTNVHCGRRYYTLAKAIRKQSNMATKTFKFSGTCKWAKVHTPVDAFDKNKPKEYTIDLYMNEGNLEEFRRSESQLRIKKDEAENQTYVRFRCPSQVMINGEEVVFKPEVLDENGVPTDEPIGNGSAVTISVDVYDTRMGKGSRLKKVEIDRLVPYERAA
jgi:hypothetical protein